MQQEENLKLQIDKVKFALEKEQFEKIKKEEEMTSLITSVVKAKLEIERLRKRNKTLENRLDYITNKKPHREEKKEEFDV